MTTTKKPLELELHLNIYLPEESDLYFEPKVEVFTDVNIRNATSINGYIKVPVDVKVEGIEVEKTANGIRINATK